VKGIPERRNYGKMYSYNSHIDGGMCFHLVENMEGEVRDK